MAEVAEKAVVKIKPLGDRALIERSEAELRTASGIVLPGSKEKPQEGIVRAVGPGARDKDGKVIPLSVKVGDKIIFGKYSGSEVKLGDREYVVLREDDIIGIIE